MIYATAADQDQFLNWWPLEPMVNRWGISLQSDEQL